MCVCVHVVCTCMHLCAHMYPCVYVHLHVCACVYVCVTGVHAYEHACVYVGTCVHMCVYVCVLFWVSLINPWPLANVQSKVI